ncbi:virion structural protein [Pseudomonas phage PA1C]|uniref:Virion structural protein n=1 Tax=Pseudomonas phage vB_PaeM_PS119XW TaxID=2601632 RepID=A0A5C1K7I0_9CAUD|nr:virion structural protein [Pseudomonas phage vB_PaeM_PS119XW]QBX32323.1 virion structural protein [Pseudomonas phage PA1C]QEM41896.1 hypothetical protein [Pseudomonas phage vB_PaeM_PS119XW]BEG72412.1 hypothetical protein RVBP21_0400 [Pseudomonas phage BRkr]
MSDRFPYNLPSRAALCRLIRETSKHKNIQDEFVNFEDMFFSPTSGVPGRTYIEMIDNKASLKDWFVYRRLELSHPDCLGPNPSIKLSGVATPAAIAEEINRSRKMTFGPDDLSFSTTVINTKDDVFEYELVAMTGSYAYFGSTIVTIEMVEGNQYARLLEDGGYRLMEDGLIRELEH